MINFMQHDFNISRIRSTYSLKESGGKSVYKEKVRPGHGLVLYLGGERRITFEDGKKLTVKENTIVYLPKGSSYIIKEISSSSFYIINFDMPEGAEFEPFALKLKNIDIFLDSYKTGRHIWKRKSIGYKTKVKSELYNIIYNMQREYVLPYSGNSLGKIKPAVDFIHSNYDKGNISVSYLADICNMSEVHLRNIFLKNFSLTPIKYINELRMSLAKELLLSGLHTVREVCFLSGFQDESYFSREFKKKFSITPGEYAKTSRD